MRLMVTTPSGELGVIVGYCPNSKGQPQAIVLLSTGQLTHYSLPDVHLCDQPPKKLRKKFRESSA
jgi:hypothetical protein